MNTEQVCGILKVSDVWIIKLGKIGVGIPIVPRMGPGGRQFTYDDIEKLKFLKMCSEMGIRTKYFTSLLKKTSKEERASMVACWEPIRKRICRLKELGR